MATGRKSTDLTPHTLCINHFRRRVARFTARDSQLGARRAQFPFASKGYHLLFAVVDKRAAPGGHWKRGAAGVDRRGARVPQHGYVARASVLPKSAASGAAAHVHERGALLRAHASRAARSPLRLRVALVAVVALEAIAPPSALWLSEPALAAAGRLVEKARRWLPSRQSLEEVSQRRHLDEGGLTAACGMACNAACSHSSG